MPPETTTLWNNTATLAHQFNMKFHQEYEALIKELNKWVVQPTVVGSRWNLTEIEGAWTATIPVIAGDAFMLNAPVPHIVRVTPFDTQKQTTYPRVIVGRMMISMALATRFVNNDLDLKAWIYDALRQVCELKGISVNTLTYGNHLISFKRPGEGNQYGREMENAPAIELRYFSDCITLEKAKEIMNEANQNPQTGS